AAAIDEQSLVAAPAGAVDVDAHADEGADGARREPVAADLVAGEGGLLQQEHLEAGLRQPISGRRSGGACPDDDDICVSGGVGHFAPSSARSLVKFFTRIRWGVSSFIATGAYF